MAMTSACSSASWRLGDTPAATVNQLNQAFRAALADPDVKQALHSQGIVPAQDQSPAALTGFIAEEVLQMRAR